MKTWEVIFDYVMAGFLAGGLLFFVGWILYKGLPSVHKALSSKKGKNIIGIVYGLGASIVLLGAVCKLTHTSLFGFEAGVCQPNFLLKLGLYVEALIFLISAFEKPHVEPEWAKVYPELEGGEAKNQVERTRNASSMGQLESVANLSESDIEKLRKGINTLSENASKMADISNAFAVTEEYTKNMRNVADKARVLEVQLQNVADLKLNTTMSEYITKVKESETLVGDLNKQMNGLKDNMSQLNQVYGNMVSAMKIK